jgi:hypothetical protein
MSWSLQKILPLFTYLTLLNLKIKIFTKLYKFSLTSSPCF